MKTIPLSTDFEVRVRDYSYISKYLLKLKGLRIMMRIDQKLALATACLAICSAVSVKPVSAIDNNLSGQLIAQLSFNEESFTKETTQMSQASQDDVSSPKSSDEYWIMPFLWGLGGYLIGSLVGTNKTYTKMNKGR